MKLFFKKIVVLALVVSCCMALSVNAYAVQLRFINELVGSNELTISGGEATLYSEVAGSADVTKVVMTHVLQKKSVGHPSSFADRPDPCTDILVINHLSAAPSVFLFFGT